MRILGIDSSCDDTSVALVEVESPTPSSVSPSGMGRKFEILAEITASQIDIHKKYGGVVPEVAGRAHAENIFPVIEEVMKGQEKPDAIAVTSGPGLITGLIVGVEAAKALSYLWDVPIAAVNHIEGHIHSVEIKNLELKIKNYLSCHSSKAKADELTQKTSLRGAREPKRVSGRSNPDVSERTLEAGSDAFPALCLIASGGHTELIIMKNHGEYEKIGATRDDAAGECFDKIAKLLGFDYPGGPKISKRAETGRADAIPFPRPMIHENNYDFSFAGLKTAALYWLQNNIKEKNDMCYVLRDTCLTDFCASFEQAINDVLVSKTMKAIKEFKPKNIIFAGGVSANKKIRETLANSIKTPNSELRTPELRYCMDNGAMIAAAGYYKSVKKQFTHWSELVADPNWEIAGFDK